MPLNSVSLLTAITLERTSQPSQHGMQVGELLSNQWSWFPIVGGKRKQKHGLFLQSLLFHWSCHSKPTFYVIKMQSNKSMIIE